MKKTILLIASLLLSLTVAFAQFKGTVTMTSTENEDKVVFTLDGKQVKMSPEMEENAPEVYMNGETGDIVVVAQDGEEVFAMKLNLNSNSMLSSQMRMATQRLEEEEKNNPTKITWTGIEKTVNGYKCEKVTGENKEGEFTAWVTKDLDLEFTDLFPINSPMTESVKKKMGASGFEGFPMRIVTTDENGKTTEMDFIVKEKSVSSSEVTPAEGLEVLDFDNFMAEIMAAQDDPKEMERLQKKMQRAMKMMQK